MVSPSGSWPAGSQAAAALGASENSLYVDYDLRSILDILVNGEHMLRHPILFYSFAYRASQRFSVARLIAPLIIPPDVGQAPVREFFTWRLPEKPLHPTKRSR
jgi:hypothetical protein